MGAPKASAQFTLTHVGTGIATNQQDGLARSVAVSGDWAYVANNGDGLRIFNVSDPANPIEVWHFTNPYPVGAFSRAVCLSGDHAYLANGFDGLRVFDISDPEHAECIGHAYPGGYAVGIAIQGNYAYLAGFDSGLMILDISSPTNPVPVSQVNNGGNAYAVALLGTNAYLANGGDGLRVYDISTPSTPTNIGHTNVDWPAQPYDAIAIQISGHYAYVAHDSGGMQIYDISNPVSPVWVNGISFATPTPSVALSSDARFAFLGCYAGGLHMCDITDPGDIRIVDTSYASDFNYGLATQGNYVYVADGFGGLKIFLLQPQLSIARTDAGDLSLSWPPPIAGSLILEQSSDLNATSWLTVTNQPTLENGRNEVTLTPMGDSRFFRLLVQH